MSSSNLTNNFTSDKNTSLSNPFANTLTSTTNNDLLTKKNKSFSSPAVTSYTIPDDNFTEKNISYSTPAVTTLVQDDNFTEKNISNSSPFLTTVLTTTPNDSLCDSDSDSDTDSELSSSDSDTVINYFKGIGTWGTYGIHVKSFCDKFRPVTRFEGYKNLELTEEEVNGCLTDRIVACCSSYLEKCPLIGKFVKCKCVLSNKGLKDIDVLKYHHYLQYLDMSFNRLTDVSILENLPFLIHLDVSHNKIEDLLDFRPPYNLTFVNYSHNLIKHIKDLSGFWALKSLNLSNNHISKIEGLRTLRYLETLDLSYNNIEVIENLDHLYIINLNLHHNKIHSFICDSRKGFKTMPVLSYVRLGHNDLTGLKMFELSAFIQSIDIQANHISNLIEISYLQDLNLLLSVNFDKNPIRNFTNYENVCIETITNLQYLDGSPVELDKKIFAKPSFFHDTKMKASQDHANIITLSHLTKLPCLGVNVIPFDLPSRPIIVVVSPLGSKQDVLIKKFAKKYCHHVTRLVCHTDKDMLDAEKDGDDFKFVTRKEFNDLLENGEFLMVYSIMNDNYGLLQEELSRGVQESGKVMIISADLIAALAFRLRGFRPFLVLAMPKCKQVHRHWLMEAYETRVFNIRYPEAAIKIFNRENMETLYTTTSDISTCSYEIKADHLLCTSPKKSIEEEFSFADHILSENEEEDYDDMQRIYRKLSGMKNYYWPNQRLQKLYETKNAQNYNSKSSETPFNSLENCDDISTTDQEQLVNQYDFDLSCEGSTIVFPENLVQDFYTKVIKSREMFLDFHRQNPGVFYDVIYTDEMDSSLVKLKHTAKMAIRTQLKESHFKKFENKDICQNFIRDRLKMLDDDIEKAMVRNINCIKNN